MNFICKEFKDLKIIELFEIYKKRVGVFVVEQNCPYQEVDNNDLISLHIMGIKDNEICAYCRIIPKNNKIRIGRVLVPKIYRRQGIAIQLMKKALEIINEKYHGKKVIIQAQAYLQKFYENFGFYAVSDVYLEDDIPHIDMLLKL